MGVDTVVSFGAPRRFGLRGNSLRAKYVPPVRAVNLGFTRIEPLNLKTVKTLGIAIPPSLRLRADEIIE